MKFKIKGEHNIVYTAEYLSEEDRYKVSWPGRKGIESGWVTYAKEEAEGLIERGLWVRVFDFKDYYNQIKDL